MSRIENMSIPKIYEQISTKICYIIEKITVFILNFFSSLADLFQETPKTNLHSLKHLSSMETEEGGETPSKAEKARSFSISIIT